VDESNLALRYARWRKSRAGALIERLEMDLIFEMAGDLGGTLLLDAGMGDGAWARMAHGRGAQVVGLDSDPGMLNAAQLSASPEPTPAMVQGKIQALPFADNTFDRVLAITSICFVEDPAPVFAEFARVLRPGGELLLGELGRDNAWAAWRRLKGWARHPTWSKAHFRSEARLRRGLEGAGFEIADARGAVFFLPLPLMPKLMAKLDPMLGRFTTIGAAFVAMKAVAPAN
jgi:ubiquinone/menaquinone biosynthesis C-methylase UbiE